MTNKTKFPTDWSQMTDSLVLENIQYMTKHRKKYYVRVIDQNTAQVDNVRIVFYTIEQHGYMVNVAKINNRSIRNDQNCNLYSAVQNLYDACKQDNIKKYEKSIKKNRYFSLFGTSVVIATIMCITILMANAELEKQEKEKQEKIEWAKDLLKKYEQERSKTDVVNVDSLINQYIR